MEKFKACEREIKTKAFSKEGLWQATKLDPKEQEKEEIMSWLQQKIEELQMQIEQAEAEIESILAGKNQAKSGTGSARPKELETLNKRRKWHIKRLEIVLRLLNNGTLDTERAIELKEDVAYTVECNTVCFFLQVLTCKTLLKSFRKMTLMNTKGYMMNLISAQRKRSFVVWLMTTMIVMSRMMKVCLGERFYF